MAEKSGELDYTEGTEREAKGLTTTNFDNDDLMEFHSEAAEDDLTPPDDTEQIREQIEETRSQMSETIDAIQDKLSIANLTEQVKDQVSEQISSAVEDAKEAIFGKAANVVNTVGRSFRQASKSELAKKAQENPWLLSIIGMGIGAILVGTLFGGKKKKKSISYRYKNFKDGYNPDEFRHTNRSQHKSESGESGESTYQSARNKVSNAANTAYDSLSNAAGSVYQGVGSAAGKTYENVGKASSFVSEKAGDLGGEMKKNYEHYIEENPLVVGAVAFAVGAAVGYAIPLTKTENNYLGEMRDNVLEKAQASAQDAIGTVKQVIGEAQQMIVDEVKSQTAS